MCCRSWYQPTVKLSMLGIFFLWNYCKWDYGGFSSMLFWKFVSSMFISFLFFIYNLHTHTVLHLVLCNCKQAKEGVFYNLKVHLQVFIALLSFMTHSMERPFVGHLKSYVLIYVILFDINVCSCHRFLILDLCQESLSTFWTL